MNVSSCPVLPCSPAFSTSAARAVSPGMDSTSLSRSLYRFRSAFGGKRLRCELAICLVQFLGLMMLLSSGQAVAQTGTLIAFKTPQQGYAATNGQFKVSLDLKSGAQPSTLRVTSGYTDVTSLFNVNVCAQAPCTLSATLTTADGIVAGQNFLTASVLGTGGSAQTANMQFGGSGVSDPTNGSAPGYIVPVQQTTTASSSSITIGTPTAIVVQSCTGNSVRIAVLNRSTLALKNTNCLADTAVAPFLLGLDQSDIVFVLSAPGGTTGKADFTAMGGSLAIPGGYTQYAAVGYGKASAGMAHQAWYDAHQRGNAYATVRGTLVNMGCQSLYGTDSKGNTVPPGALPACSTNQSASLYSFFATDNMGFAIIPGAVGSAGNPGVPTIYVGNSSNIPVGDSTIPSNQVRPVNSNTKSDFFTYTTYTPNSADVNGDGGVYLVVLNSIDMSLISKTLYRTNCGANCSDLSVDNSEISALAAALTTATSNLTTAPASQYPNQIYLFTTAGIPFAIGSNTAPLISAVSALGISPYALQAVIPDNLGTPPGTGFSFVSYALEPHAATLGASTTSVPGVDTTSSNPVRLWSSSANTQQGETGALRGVFVKGIDSYYAPTDVGPFKVSDLPVYATGDDYLSHAASYAVGSTEPVAWPYMGTAGGRAAYSYLSFQLINFNLFTGGDPNSTNQCSSECDDIRFWYTGDQAANLYTPLAAGQVEYPGDSTAAADGFTKADFDNVQQQLDLEQVYLKEVLALKSYAEQMNTDTSQNVALALTQAGTNIALDMQDQLGTSQKQVGDTPIRIAGDTFNLIAGGASALFPFYSGDNPRIKIGIPVGDGVAWALSAILTIVADAETNTTNTQPDPYVVQLQQLISAESNEATAAATNFNANLETATGTFYNGVFSDWFRLQSAALMSVNQGYGGWYVADTDQGAELGAQISALTAAQRIQLWQQILPQYFTKAQYNGVASGWLMYEYPIYTDDLGDVAKYFSSFYPYNLGTPPCGRDCTQPVLDPSAGVQAGWTTRTSAGQPAVCQDITYIFQGKFGHFWTSTIGATLMGATTGTSGLSNLSIDPNWLFDEWGIPWLGKSTDGFPMNFPQNVGDVLKLDQDIDNQTFSWSCGSHSWPFGGQSAVVFSNLTISPATITQGTAKVTVSGNLSVSGSTKIPSGSVSITIDDIIQTAKISSTDGTFSSIFATQSIPGSPTPYVISISYAGTSSVSPSTDVSQTLTVLSPDTDVQLSADLNPSYYGQTVNLLATVKSPAAATPTGLVTFYDSAATLGTKSLDSNGLAKLPVAQLAAGTHLVTASYAGANGIAGNTSDLSYIKVNPLTTALVVSSPTTIVAFGSPTVHLTGQLVGKNASTVVSFPPAGESVAITINQVTQSTTLTANGSFALDFPVTTFPVGTYPVQIVYNGDNNFTPLTDQTTSLAVGKATTTFGALTPSETIQAGTQSITLSGKLVTLNGITPTGTVKVIINQTESTSVALTDGSFTLSFNTATLLASATPYPIEYSYSGDSNYVLTSGGSTTLTVLQTAISTSFRNLTPSQAIDYGRPTVTLSGTISTAPQFGGVLTQGVNTGATFVYTTIDAPNDANTIHATFSLWINTTEKSKQMILDNLNNSPTDYSGNMGVYMQGDQIGVHWAGGQYPSDDWLSTNMTPISDGQWHHIAIVFGAEAANSLWYARLYKDGVSTGETFGEHQAYFEAPLALAVGSNDGSIPGFTGEVWNAKIWNKALSPSDLAADIYQFYQTPTPIGLLLQSSFDPVTKLAVNVVGNATATPLDGLTIVNEQLPAQAPPAGEQVSINVGANTQQATIGLLGSFSLDFAATGITPGNYPIQYRYSGDSSFSTASDAGTTLVVQPAATKISLASFPSSTTSIVYGSPLTFTATVSADNVVPTGTVTFYDGTTVIGQGLLTASTASFSPPSLAVGSHSIMAVYPGGTGYASSTSAIIPVTIKALTPTFSNLTSSTISYGTSSVTLGGTIAAGGSIPSGSVTITVSGSSTVKASAPIKLDGSFSGSPDTSKLAMGTYQVTYTYSANGNFGDATDNSTKLIVGLASANPSLTSSLGNSAPYGTVITLTTIVTSSIGSPTGSVKFMDGATALGPAVNLSGGAAVLQTSTLAAGLHFITAIYSGDTTFAASTSNIVPQNVVALTPVFVTISPSQIIPVGTASVAVGGKINAGTTFIPSGTVAITINGSITPATIQSDGTFSATVDTHALGFDSYAVIYSFAASGNFNAASDSSTRITVAAGNTSTQLSSSGTTADYGTSIAFTATVSNPNTATGSVTFYDNGNPLGSPVTVTAGKVVWETASLSVGTHSMTAVYTSDSPNYIGSTSAVHTETINALASLFSNLTPSQTANADTSNVTLAGTISSQPASGSVLQFATSKSDASGGIVLPYDTTGVSTDGASYSMWINTTVKTQQVLFQTAYTHPAVLMQGDQLIVQWEYWPQRDFHSWTSTDTTPISDGRWHHIAITFSQGKVTIYKDGVATSDSFTISDLGTADSPINIGAGDFYRVPSFIGQTWNTKIWAGALSAGDIAADMYETYSNAIPANVRVLASLDANASTADNRVNGQTAAVDSNSLASIATVLLPAYYPVANEPVSITIGSQTQTVNVGAGGSFASTFPLGGLAADSYPIQYSYKGNAYLASSTDSTTKMTVQNTSTTTHLDSSSLSVDYGTLVTFTATVASQSGGTPTGTVTFLDGSSPLCSQVTLNAEQAKCSTSKLAVGSHSITAAYVSDGPTFAGSTSNIVQPNINKLNPVFTNLAAPSITAGTGTSILGGNIAAGSVIPSGDIVSITLNGAKKSGAIGSDGSFSASFDTSLLAAGSYGITYAYAGSTNLNGVTDNSKSLTVASAGPVTPTLTMTFSSNPAVAGQDITLKATVHQVGSIVPTGNVTFSETEGTDGKPLPGGVVITYGDADLVDGTATLTVTATSNPTFTSGQHVLVATYGGDGGINYNGNSSPFYTLTVNPLVGSSPGFSLTVANGGTTTATVAQGVSANFPLSLASVSGFTGSVALTCTPADAVTTIGCSISPALVTLSSAAQTATVTITTMDATAKVVRKMALLIGGLGLIPLLFKRRRALASLFLLVALATFASTGCGGGGSSQKLQYANPGTYNFTITASSTSGTSATSSVKVSVVVQ